MRERTWWRFWAMAAFAHVVAKPRTELSPEGIVNLVVGWLAIAVIVHPDRSWCRNLLAASIVVSAVLEAPFLGNHWLLASIVSAAALVAASSDSSTRFERFAATARVLLLVAYGFAAFAKLNSGFADPVESCARYFANKTLEFWRLPTVADGPMATGLIVATIVIELSVPVLLLIPSTRRFGVFVAFGFHLALTLDLRQQLQQFTLVLVPLFALFAPASFLATLDGCLPRLRLLKGWPWIAMAGLQVAAIQLPLGSVAARLGSWAAWGTWMVVLGALGLGLVRAWNQTRLAPAGWSLPGLRFKPANALASLIVALAVLNGLSPYLGLKTATGFNMFANLVAADGRTNHFVITRIANLRGDEATPVEILESDDEWLAFYVDGGYDLPAINVADYLALSPSASATIRWPDGTVDEIDRSGSDEPVDEAFGGTQRLQARPTPWWKERFLALLAVPADDGAPCETPRLPVR